MTYRYGSRRPGHLRSTASPPLRFMMSCNPNPNDTANDTANPNADAVGLG